MRKLGRVQVRVWVPTEGDADRIKRLAAEMREGAEAE
jgi:hypothetical protein